MLEIIMLYKYAYIWNWWVSILKMNSKMLSLFEILDFIKSA